VFEAACTVEEITTVLNGKQKTSLGAMSCKVSPIHEGLKAFANELKYNLARQ